LLPSLWVCSIAYIFSNNRSIYASQVQNRAKSPAHQGSYVHQVLAEVYVAEFLAKQQPVAALHASDALDVVLDRFDASPLPVLPVADADDRLLGVIDLEEVHIASQSGVLPSLVLAADLMRSDVQPLTPLNTLDRALELFVENDLMALPVVDNSQNRTLVGMLRRFDISNAYVRHLHGPRLNA
jgi:chloride channel protein, CIC family